MGGRSPGTRDGGWDSTFSQGESSKTRRSYGDRGRGLYECVAPGVRSGTPGLKKVRQEGSGSDGRVCEGEGDQVQETGLHEGSVVELTFPTPETQKDGDVEDRTRMVGGVEEEISGGESGTGRSETSSRPF